MIIPTTLQIKPEVANPLPPSFVFTISLVAFLETTTPITPSINPMYGIRIERTPRVKEITSYCLFEFFQPCSFLFPLDSQYKKIVACLYVNNNYPLLYSHFSSLQECCPLLQ